MGGKGSGNRGRTSATDAHDMTCVDRDTNHQVLGFLEEVMQLPPMDYTSTDEIKQRFYDYLELCDKHGVKPLMMSCAMAYKMNKPLFTQLAHGDHNIWKTKGLTEESREFFVEIYGFLEGVVELSLAQEKGNPVKWIVFAKNHYGYRDQTERIIRYDNERPSLPNADDVARKYAGLVGRDEPQEIEATVEPVYELPVKSRDE